MITTEQVKELRDKTGVSIMQCRKALEEAQGDMDKAMIILRKKGSEMAEKKSDRNAADGSLIVRTDGKRALVLTLNCETDFVAKNADFQTLGNKIVDIAWDEGVEKAKAEAPTLINDVVLKIGENIQLGSIEEVAGDTVGAYIHHTGKVAAVVTLKGGTPDVAKDVAMHVAAMRPTYLKAEDIDEAARSSVIEVLRKEVDESNKPEEIKTKMLEGKLGSYFKEQTLLDQGFFKNPEITIQKYVSDSGATVESFMVYTV